MGGFNNHNTRWIFGFIICLFLYVPPTIIYAQPGFVSIQCCSDTTFNDPSTGITWITDEHWWPDNSYCEDITRAVQKDTDYTKSRVFNSDNAPKWCYKLNTIRNGNYLIRGTFLFGDLQATSLASMFSVFVDSTLIGRVDSPCTIEGVFKATTDSVDFCLLKDFGEPYISKLELRPVASDYLSLEPFSVLRVMQRVDVGNTVTEFRYPYDQYDRVWAHYVYPDTTATQITSSLRSINSNNLTVVFPPLEVLQTAISHTEKLEFLHDNLGPIGSRYNLYLYFVELNASVEAGQRVFDVYVNNVKRVQVDVVLGGSRSLKVTLNVTTFRHLNLTMVNNGSQLGPMINAYEIFEVHSILVQDTLQAEVDTIMAVKNELEEHNSENEILKSWSGDPCVPASWPGLFCQLINGTTVITKIDLSFCKLSGNLPPSVTKLTHLRILNMSSNNFCGTIPLFPASSSLNSMDISHNNLVGDITEQLLVSLPNLSTLYFGCNNNLDKRLPNSIPIPNLTTDSDLGLCNGKGDKTTHLANGKLIGAVTGGCLLAALAIGISLTSVFRRKSKSKTEKLNEKGYPMTKNAVYSIPTDIMPKSISVDSYTLKFLETATEKYKLLIGEGGFGPVYRGALPDGQEVAVKVRSSTSTQGTREFDNEVNLLSDIRHENLVPLLGYCCESDQQILVYPFMSNGSLQDRLYGEAARRKTLDWPTRISIALGAARGLTYLHTFSRRSLIHRDVKSSNILLDQSMCAKVADFGFSKYAPQEGDSATSLEVRGTAGYLDPEYYSTQQLSAKSDVFSFGVVLLEIVTGREPLNINRQRNEWSLVEWAKPRIRNARIEEIADPSIKGGYHAEAMWRVLEVAQACIEPYSAYRPCMSDIVRELEDALIIENNASEYMKSIDSFGGSSRFSIDRPVVILPTIQAQSEVSPMLLSQPPLPQPR